MQSKVRKVQRVQRVQSKAGFGVSGFLDSRETGGEEYNEEDGKMDEPEEMWMSVLVSLWCCGRLTGARLAVLLD